MEKTNPGLRSRIGASVRCTRWFSWAQCSNGTPAAELLSRPADSPQARRTKRAWTDGRRWGTDRDSRYRTAVPENSRRRTPHDAGLIDSRLTHSAYLRD